MPRVTHVKKARASKKPRSCTVCYREILEGESYSWIKIKMSYGGMVRCVCSQHRFRPSMMTLSPHLSALYAAQEAAEDAVGDISDPTPADGQIVRDLAEAIRGVGEGYRESAENIESGFGHPTYQSEELTEKADSCDSCADEMESAADDIEGMDDPEDVEAIRDEFDKDDDDDTDGEDDDAEDSSAEEEFIAEKQEERRDAIREAIEEAIQESPDV